MLIRIPHSRKHLSLDGEKIERFLHRGPTMGTDSEWDTEWHNTEERVTHLMSRRNVFKGIYAVKCVLIYGCLLIYFLIIPA